MLETDFSERRTAGQNLVNLPGHGTWEMKSQRSPGITVTSVSGLPAEILWPAQGGITPTQGR